MRLQDNLYEVAECRESERTFDIVLDKDSLIYKAHFPERPVTPGVVVVQIAGELLGILLGRDLELKEVVNAKFLSVIDPRETHAVSYRFLKLAADESAATVRVSVDVTDGTTLFARLSLQYRLK